MCDRRPTVEGIGSAGFHGGHAHSGGTWMSLSGDSVLIIHAKNICYYFKLNYELCLPEGQRLCTPSAASR